MTAPVSERGSQHLADARAWYDRSSERAPTAVRIGIFLAVVLAAYHYSLLSLTQSLGLESPLAYVGLTPLIAAVLAILQARKAPVGPPIHDRQLDYIIGIPLLAAALVLNVVFPRQLSAMFWVWRIDLLSLPLFVAGSASCLFGVRAMWRQRLAIGFLFLAWPFPYQVLLFRFLDGFTRITQDALKLMLTIVPVARSISSADGSLFEVLNKTPFPVSVVSACSGVNGMVGFILVGAAFAALVRGPRLRKMVWLIGGLFVLWVANLGRILFILYAGKRWGQDVAIGFFHPFIGLLTFNAGIVAMLLALRPMGLRIEGVGDRPARPASAPGALETKAAPAVAKVGAAVIVVGVLGGMLFGANSNLVSFDLVASAAGAPKLAAYVDAPSAPQGWKTEVAGEFTFARPYFGASSKWIRYAMFRDPTKPAGLQSDGAVIADVINTSNLRSFSAYGVEACYRFHGYTLRNIASVKLGGGIEGETLSYYNRRRAQDWTVLFWVWPVKGRQGHTRYERVTLYIQNAGRVTSTAPDSVDVRSLQGDPSRFDEVDRKLVSVRDFLAAFARDVVAHRGEHPLNAP